MFYEFCRLILMLVAFQPDVLYCIVLCEFCSAVLVLCVVLRVMPGLLPVVLFLLHCIPFGSRCTSCSVSSAPRLLSLLSCPLNCVVLYLSKYVRYCLRMFCVILTAKIIRGS